ncbi:DUF1372 family protein [Streptococcus parauberis]|uniref:Uncharacterized protein n=1 Tax=Streptococcus parauberis KRS-02083 TaxID=1207545 RepID=A0ABP2SW07_9STRE|nr:DUF1372 family protein [Streptococcus parauberis]QBX27437.1 hypothetical protein Javan386_0038 [Streptococcus phage Javan386]QBX27542.1 hypothetical protein Javan394_0031 [Streptococcus phage Javan394]EMG24672.1 hypothetical protein SPJ1_1931 [Streptococcus parauberis KRS-02083]UWM90932.1 DUF1372 family protein [Streptococcus parauberis]WEM65256.1 DUF1372 family protein [Streptococcus parauberis]
MKSKFKKIINLLKHLGNLWILISISVLPAFTYVKVDEIEKKIDVIEHKVQKPTIKYQTDSVGGIGYVSVKDGNVITVPGYGQFLLNDSEAAIIQVGDKVPSYVLKRGN